MKMNNLHIKDKILLSQSNIINLNLWREETSLLRTIKDKMCWSQDVPYFIGGGNGYDWRDTMGGTQVHYNRDLLKGNHSRGARAPGSATYVN